MFMNYNLLAIIHDCDVTLHAAGAIFVYMRNSNDAPRYFVGFYFKTTWFRNVNKLRVPDKLFHIDFYAFFFIPNALHILNL